MRVRLRTPHIDWDDILALVLIVGALVLIGMGRDGEMKAILGLAAGWIFGKQRESRR